MKFDDALVHGRLLRRYKRFLADVVLDDGTQVTAHCTNSGSMLSCLEEGAEVWLSPAKDPKRRTRYTWEMIRIGGDWVGINTSTPNRLAFEWIRAGVVPGLEGLKDLRREVKWEDSRFDLYGVEEGDPGNGAQKYVLGSGAQGGMLDGGARKDDLGGDGRKGAEGRGCFIEVKNVTLKEGDRALFPDSVTERGRKHLQTLVRVIEAGMRAVMLYVVQRTDVEIFSPAREIDPAYGTALDEAVRRGVEVIVVQARVSPGNIDFHRVLPAEL
jgi:sugar fermentation stimulation protein A